jgi:transposase
MAKGYTVDERIKTEIINKIRDEGMTVVEAAHTYHVGKTAVYRWLQLGVTSTGPNLILENNKLKKEIDQLYNLLGRATVEMKRPKR